MTPEVVSVRAQVWGGPLDGQWLAEPPPTFHRVVPRKLHVVDMADDQTSADAPDVDTYELMPWRAGRQEPIVYRWVHSPIADKLRRGWA